MSTNNYFIDCIHILWITIGWMATKTGISQETAAAMVETIVKDQFPDRVEKVMTVLKMTKLASAIVLKGKEGEQ